MGRPLLLLLLGGELLAERCRTDDLVPSISLLCLPPCRVDPKFCDCRSSPIVLSQVVLGRPAGLLQSDGGRSAAAMTRWWSSSGFDRARCPKNLNRKDLTLSETGKQPVVFCSPYPTPSLHALHNGRCNSNSTSVTNGNKLRFFTVILLNSLNKANNST